jgi:micrococcal nuclease
MRWPMLLASLALAFDPAGALAHGGGLDASGCHTNRKTNYYHCHGGVPSTGGGGGSSSGSRGSIYIAPAPTPAPRRTKPKQAAPAVTGPATLVSVGDGDTIRVTGANGQKVTIRMACIDAPETAQGESGTQATLVLKQLLGAGPVEIRPQTVDRYGRTVAEVYAGGRNVNLEMVRMGMAYAYRQYLSGCDENAYLGAEGQAERYRQGVWRWGNEVKPWEFRKVN